MLIKTLALNPNKIKERSITSIDRFLSNKLGGKDPLIFFERKIPKAVILSVRNYVPVISEQFPLVKVNELYSNLYYFKKVPHLGIANLRSCFLNPYSSK